MLTRLTELFPAFKANIPQAESVMFISPHAISFYPQLSPEEIQVLQERVVISQLYAQANLHKYRNLNWAVTLHENKATIARAIVIHGKIEGLILMDVNLATRLNRLRKGVNSIGQGIFLNSDGRPIENWNHVFKENQDNPLMQHPLTSPFYEHVDRLKRDYQVYTVALSAIPWQLWVVEKKSHLFEAILPSVLAVFFGIFIFAFTLIALTHFLLRQSFINPATKLLAHLESCSATPVAPPVYISKAWEPWFKLVTHTFSQHQKYTVHLSNQNKRLDKIVAQRTKKLKEINLRREREYAQLRALIDSIPDAIFFKDTQGRYLGCNKTAEEMLDLKEHQIIGVMSTAFMDDEKAQKITLEDEYVLANHTSCRYLDKIQVRSRHVCLDVSKFPFYDRQGNVLGLIGMWRDVTSEHDATEQLRLSEERYHLAMDAVEDGVWDWYIGSDQVACNPSLYTMLGCTTHEFDCSRAWIFSLIHPDDVAEQYSKLNFILKNPHTDFESEFRMRCKKGHYIWVLSRGRIVEFTKYGRPKRIVGTNKDISKQKDNEVLLVEAKEAEEASLYKSQFLANMSHEIRTPMNAVIGMLQLLQKTKLTEQQDDYISKAYNSSYILMKIITDILDVSKIEAGKLALEHIEFNMHELIQHAVELTVLPAHRKHIEMLLHLDFPKQLTCIGDSLRLSQVLINLLTNAIKFTEKGKN